MKSINYQIFTGLLLLFAVLTSCDLELQKDADYDGEALDPHINMTAWEYIQNDSDLTDMKDAIEYAGLDSIYSQTATKYTFLLIKNPALTTWANRMGYLSITDVPKSSITNLLKYHIILGEYSGYNKPTPVSPIFVMNLLKGEDALITFKVSKSAWPTYNTSVTTGNVVINMLGSNGVSPAISSSSCNILTTNGVVHIFNDFTYYQRDKAYTPLFVPSNY